MTSEPAAQQAVLETRFGPVTIHAVRWPDEEPYVVLLNPEPGRPPLLRVQAQCLTSTAFAGEMCDCAAQIEAGVRLAARSPGGTLIYLPQEGRGHGLLSKVEIMAEMNRGLSLERAQLAVGRPQGRLSYRRVPALLRAAGLDEAVVLLTDSDAKAAALAAEGVQIAEVRPLPTGSAR